MKKILLSAAAFALVAVSTVAVAPNTAEAVPAFARQTGAACTSCHFKRIPRLAAFGRNFKINAFRDVGEQALLEDEGLSLPAVFNASLLFKFDIKSQTGLVNPGIPGTQASLGIRYYDESALLIGGRYGEHFGGLTEWNGGPLSYKFYFVADTDMGPMGLGAYSTDALGMGWAMNDGSNTISRNTRSSQHRFDAYRTFMHNGVTGIGAYALLADSFYLGASAVVPQGGTNPAGFYVELKPSAYLRGAFIGEIGGLDTVLGVHYASGDVGVTNGALLGVVGVPDTWTDWGIDIQVQGDMGDIGVGFYMPIQLKGQDPLATTALGSTNNRTGYYPMLELNIGHLGVRAGYDYTKIKNDVLAQSSTLKTFVLGGYWSVAQNVELDLEYNNVKSTPIGGVSTSTSSTTLMVEYVY
ncbi:MAG: hypothetical protein ACE5DY_02180 [Mariprofundaceae bacterium]